MDLDRDEHCLVTVRERGNWADCYMIEIFVNLDPDGIWKKYPSGGILLGWSPRNLDLLVRKVVPCIVRAFCVGIAYCLVTVAWGYVLVNRFGGTAYCCVIARF